MHNAKNIMQIKLTFILLLMTMTVYGQSQEKKDSLINEICKVITEKQGEPDSVRIFTAYEKHLYPFLEKYPEDQRQEIGNGIYFRMQRNCKEFKEILIRLDPPNGDWETIEEKPKTKLTKKLCKQFLDHKNYKYLETTGDTVKLQIEHGFWIDKFKDGTYSKLKLKWVNDCEFDIEFIESNNEIRKHFSKPGDKYRYQVVDKKNNYYDMSVEIAATGQQVIFKIYY